METNFTKNILVSLILILCFNIGKSQISSIFEPIDVFDIEHVSDPQISPDDDDRLILYQRNFKDIMTDRNMSNIWLVNFDGTENRPLTTGNNNDFSPRWSNSGKMFTYKSNKTGKTHLYLHNLENGSTQKLTNMQSSVGNVSWSDDDK